MPKVSIIIPIHNVEKYLGMCLDSILLQTYKDFEVICVNDGSPDNSEKILNDYAKKDNRIKVITQKNQGVSAARNNGIKNAEGEYIAFLDPDDMMHQSFLEIMIKAMQDTNSEISCCEFKDVPESATYKKEEIKQLPQYQVSQNVLEDFLDRKFNIHFNIWNKIYKKELATKHTFDELLCVAEDRLWSHKTFNEAKKAVYIPISLIDYRQKEKGFDEKSPLNTKIVDSVLLSASKMIEYFNAQNLNKKTKKLLYFKIMRLILKKSTYYIKKKSPQDYLKHWVYYADNLKKLQQQGLYKPQYLPFYMRLKSQLFINKRFKLLNYIV